MLGAHQVLDQGTNAEEHQGQPQQAAHQIAQGILPVGGLQPARLRRCHRLGTGEIEHLQADLVATGAVEAHRAFHHLADLFQLLGTPAPFGADLLIEQDGDVHPLQPSLLVAGMHYGAAVFILLADLLPLGAGVVLGRLLCSILLGGGLIGLGRRFRGAVGEGPRDAEGQGIYGLVGLVGFLGHHTIGIQLLLGLLHRIEVDVCGDLHPEVAGAQHGIEHVIGALADVLLQLAHVFHLLDALLAEPGLVPQLGAQQLARLIHHGHGAGLHAGDAARHQVGDRLHLARLHGLPGLQIQHHGGAGLLLVTADEQGPLRDGQMHPGTTHRVEGDDGSGQLSLQGMAVARSFHELAGAEAGDIVQPLQARRHGRPDPPRRQRHTHVGQLALRHQDLARALLQPKRHLLLLQHLHDVGGVVELLLAVEGHIVLAGGPEDHHYGGGDHGGQQGDGEDGLVVPRQGAPVAHPFLYPGDQGAGRPRRG